MATQKKKLAPLTIVTTNHASITEPARIDELLKELHLIIARGRYVFPVLMGGFALLVT
ncbi:MAG: hypothetical protein AB7Q04_12280 [Steroidobacteraceae bacterium]